MTLRKLWPSFLCLLLGSCIISEAPHHAWLGFHEHYEGDTVVFTVYDGLRCDCNGCCFVLFSATMLEVHDEPAKSRVVWEIVTVDRPKVRKELRYGVVSAGMEATHIAEPLRKGQRYVLMVALPYERYHAFVYDPPQKR